MDGLIILSFLSPLTSCPNMSKSKASILILSIVVPLIVACSNSEPGEDTPDASASTVDANTPDIDATPTGPAANLGARCPCPNGEPCIVATGRCTIACDEHGGLGGCDVGYTGPGLAYCGGGASDDPFCIVGCGEQTGGDLSCPHDLVCTDDANMNGMPDVCANP